MKSVFSFAAGKYARWAIVAVWLIIIMGTGSLGGKFEDVQKNEQASYLPGEAESVKTITAVEKFPSGQNTPAITVYQREGGLTPADFAVIQKQCLELAENPPPYSISPTAQQCKTMLPATGKPPAEVDTGRANHQTGPPPIAISKDGSTVLVTNTVLLAKSIKAGSEFEGQQVGKAKPNAEPAKDSGKRIVAATDDIRDTVGEGTDGLEIRVGGAAGFSTDSIKTFEGINSTLLLAAAALVFILLIVIYRSPIFWIIPFFSVIVAESVVRGLGYLLAEAGTTINGQTAGIMSVLVFGAGTDYALLLVARYREELSTHEKREESMKLALREAGPAIFASALTVIAALLCLTFAEVNGTAGLGPVSAVGVAVAMLVMLTLLPAVLVIVPRGVFWPFVPRYGKPVGASETSGYFRRIGDRISKHPRRVWLGTAVIFGIACLGLFAYNTDLRQTDSFRGKPESVQAQDLIAKAFPSGTDAPADVVVPSADKVGAVVAALQSQPAVATVVPIEDGKPGTRLRLVFKSDAYSGEVQDQIPEIRKVAEQAGGSDVLVGGPSAVQYDLNIAADHDSMLIPPIVLLVIFLILVLLLRAVVAPLLLLGTVILSFGATLGISALIFKYIFDFPGSDSSLLLYVFIFLVALGVDYNIFLMARAREETLEHGTREGMLRALAVTGTVITSAGIVLAGTFCVLGVLPLVPLTQIGVAVALGVLLDTFFVRTILVPGLVLDIGKKIWWPSKLAQIEDEKK